MNFHAAYRWASGFALMALAGALLAQAQADARPDTSALEQQGQNAQAAAEWRAYSAHHPGEPEPLAHIGQLEARQGHFSEAIAAYRKALTIAPAMPGLRPNLGLAYFKNGDYKQAIEMFSPMLKANPGDQRVTLLVGMSFYGLGEYAAATPYLKRAADGDTQNLELQLTLAHSCLFAKEYQCVLDAFHRIVALNAESAEADMIVGEALDEMHDPLGAQKEFRAAIAVDPKQPNVHFGLGYLLWTKAQYDEATAQFEAELKNNPQHALAMLYLADTQMKTGNAEQAQVSLEKLVKLMPQNPMAHRDLGTLYADAGQNDAAVTELKEAIGLAPKDAAAHWRLARLYRAMGRTADAKAEFEKTNSLNKAEDDRLIKVMGMPPPEKPDTPEKK
jgi:tetratricopeptide (TPR) repeat protein